MSDIEFFFANPFASGCMLYVSIVCMVSTTLSFLNGWKVKQHAYELDMYKARLEKNYKRRMDDLDKRENLLIKDEIRLDKKYNEVQKMLEMVNKK